MKALDEYKVKNPHLVKRVYKIAAFVRDVDKEILIMGEKIPAKTIFTPESLSLVKGMAKAGRVVQVVGIVLTAYDHEQATEKSIKTGSVKPISAEVIRQTGGGGFVAGAKIGTVAGAAVGVETGPVAVITGLIGGIIFGYAGYYGADWIADYIDEN
ncbi:hypothetical protein [Enterobacter ludwigii]|uniref:hypothetical protein n=1 Tax=Enterobacter ludwigii TaxID=299767 RepID=UPI003F5B24AF